MKQVTVIRVIPLNNLPVFQVRADGNLQGCFTFEIGAKEDSPYNEERNRLAAMTLAAKLENGNTDIEEIIYQTPKL